MEIPFNRPPNVSPSDIWIFHRLEYGYLGIDGEDALSALFPVVGRLPLIGRISGSLRVDYRNGVLIRVGDTQVTCDCCIVSTADRSLDRSFWALSKNLSEVFASRANLSATDCSREISSWEQLFQKGRRLSSEEEQGLWGELWFLASRADLDSAIRCWRGPSAEDYDFLANGLAFDVKTSRRVGRHSVSHAQVVQAVEPGTVFLTSIWVGEDPHSGLTLPQLVDDIARRTGDPVLFEQRLLDTGYSHRDRRLYDCRLRALEEFSLYDMTLVPRVTDFDSGVLSLSYVVQLNPQQALPAEKKGAVLLRSIP